MIDLLIEKLNDARFLAMIFAAVGAIATVITLAMPLLVTDSLTKRMKSVALEREKIRQRERERLARGEKVALRRSPKQYMQTIVDQFNLNKWVGQEEARVMLVVTVFYVFFVLKIDYSPLVKVGICIGATYLGMHLPSLFVKNKITRR